MSDNILKKDVTQLIKYMRENSGFSQVVLADKLGIAQTTLSGYETGYSEPNFALVEKIAKICDFDIIVLDKYSKEAIQVANRYEE